VSGKWHRVLLVVGLTLASLTALLIDEPELSLVAGSLASVAVLWLLTDMIRANRRKR
jgi:hypothetical protein